MRVFITGVSSGIGRALTVRLVNGGHQVWGVARRAGLLEKLQQELMSADLQTSVCDLGKREDCQRVAQQLKDKNFIPDVVVLNAAVLEQDVGSGGLSFRDLQTSVRINFDGALFWVAEFLPAFLQRSSGLFLAISSTSAYRPGLGSIAYPATKSALSMAFRGLRLNFAGSGVRFSVLHFGPIRSGMWQGRHSWLIPVAEGAADYIIRIFPKAGKSYFYPFLSTLLFRLSLFLPDRAFAFFSSLWRRKL